MSLYPYIFQYEIPPHTAHQQAVGALSIAKTPGMVLGVLIALGPASPPSPWLLNYPCFHYQ